MRRHGLLSVAASLSLLATTNLAHAVDPTNEAEAIALFNDGMRLSASGDYEHARVKFLAASVIVKSHHIWWNLGYSEYRSGHFVDGLRHLRKYFRLGNGEPKNVTDFNQDVLPTCLKHVGQLSIETASDALVTIDDKDEAGRAPLFDPVAVTPGKHHVVARRDNESVAADVDVPVGVTIPVTLIFKTAAAAAPDDLTGMLDRSGAPPPGQPQPPPETTRRTNPAHIWVPTSLAVGSAIFLGLGIGFAAQSNSAANDAQALRNAQAPNACRTPSAAGCAAISNDVHSQNTDQTVSLVTYVGAGTFFAAAIATWFLVPSHTESRSVAEPLIGPGMLGARWTTKF